MTELQSEWNPRFVLWCESRGFRPDSFVRETGEDSKRVLHHNGDGHLYPWGIVFSQWIQDRWTEWARSLDFKDGNGWQAHRLAQAAGHTHEEFDVWLRLKVSHGFR